MAATTACRLVSCSMYVWYNVWLETVKNWQGFLNPPELIAECSSIYPIAASFHHLLGFRAANLHHK